MRMGKEDERIVKEGRREREKRGEEDCRGMIGKRREGWEMRKEERNGREEEDRCERK